MDSLSETKTTVDPRRYFEHAAESRSATPQTPPVCLYLETTNRCNLLCTTCPRTYAELEPPADMSWELFTSIVDQIAGVQRAVLHGVGEPMLVPDLPRMVRYLKDRGTYVLFNTNGTVLNERNGRALIDAGLDELRVSLDAADAKTYKAIRGKNYFDRILRNVRAFRALQEREGHATPRVSAWLTGLKETVADLPAFVRVAADIGIKEVYLQRLVFFGDDAIGMAQARPGALRTAEPRRGGRNRRGSGAGCRLRHDLQRVGGGVRAGPQPQAPGQPVALVAVPPAVDGHVLHRQRPGAALLHRAVLAARLRELHAGRRHPADPPADLERPGLSVLPRGPADRSPTAGLRQLRDEVEPVTAGAAAATSMRVRPRVALIVPTLNEEEAIGPTLAAVPPDAVDQIVVADGGSTDRTVERARAAGAVVVSPGRGFGLGCLEAARSAESADILVFMDGDGADDPAAIPMLVAPIARGEADFVIASRTTGAREPGSLSWHQIAAGRAAGLGIGLLYGTRFTDMCTFRAVRRDVLLRLGMTEMTYGWNIEMQMRAARAGLTIVEIPVRLSSAARRRIQGSGEPARLAQGRFTDRRHLPAGGTPAGARACARAAAIVRQPGGMRN